MIDTPIRPETASGSTTGTVAELLSGILDDAQTLIPQQGAMLRAEIKEDARRTAQVVQYMSAGGVLAAVGALFLMISLVYLLNWLVPSIPMWACWAIIGAVNVLSAIAAFVIGRRLLGTYNPLPDKTLTAIEENLTWKTTTPRN